MRQQRKPADRRATSQNVARDGVVRVIQERNRAVREEGRATLNARTMQWRRKRAEIQAKIDDVRQRHQAYARQLTRTAAAAQKKNVEDVRRRLEGHRATTAPVPKPVETTPKPKPAAPTRQHAGKKGGARR